jgi:small subunit ribosomal protein S9
MLLGISRALVAFDAEYRPLLKQFKFLSRDPREKERKKYGQRKARSASSSPSVNPREVLFGFD